MNDKQDKNTNDKKRPRMNGEKKFYLFTAIGCAAVLAAIIVVAIAITNANRVENPSALRGSASVSVSDSVEDGNSSSDTPVDSTDSTTPDSSTPDEKPVVGVFEMELPLEAVTVSNDFGFYHNQTLNTYYEHKGVDFTAAAGTEVMAVESGTIESIYKEDILLGTEIVVDHGNGLKTVYRFVTEADGLTVGAKVEKGDVIATVAEATGNEYKDGPHLHFEVLENGKQVDPTLHLTLEEK